ncbi:NUDIX domain-containing protein [Streptomyces sp. HNM0574]|uniref:NUDIX hydrolase n=1 Tax=Streptomyces sp. HNM0574 TaxID=2714954 RepID=UPI003216CDA2
MVREGRLLVVSKQAAPDVYYLPGGKPDPGETPEQTLARELDEELGVTPTGLTPLVTVEDWAVLEDVPMHLTVFRAGLDREPVPAAELASMRWLRDGESDDDGPLTLAPAIARHVVPLLGLGS